MINTIIENDDYKDLITSQIDDIIKFLLNSNKEFSITANIDAVTFNPALPDSIKGQLSQYSLFILSNYTFTTIKLQNNFISFEAGFGSENFGTTVKLPLHSIFQIVLDDSILYLNPLATVDKFNKNNKEKSLNVFKNNPQNKKLIKE